MHGNSHLSRWALVGRTATYALIGLSLAACGGGNGSQSTTSTGASAQALAITTSNAAALTNELLATEQYLPNLNNLIGNIVTNTTCTAGGSLTKPANSSPPPLTYTFSQCMQFNSSTQKSLVNGSVVVDFPSPSNEYPLSVKADKFTGSNTQYDSSGNPQVNQQFNINADLTANGPNNWGVNGDFYLSLTTTPPASNNGTLDWSFSNYQLDTNSSNQPTSVSGQQTLNDLGGYVNINTDQTLTYATTGGSSCPITGQVTIDGAGSSYLQLAFNGDTVTVTVNGNANSYTCSQFTSWVGPIAILFS